MIDEVYIQGNCVARAGKTIRPVRRAHVPESLRGTLNTKPITPEVFALPLESPRAHVIGVIPKSIVTEHLILDVPLQEGHFVPVPEEDLLKIAVIVGASDEEMRLAAERLVQAGGGVIAVNGQDVLAELPLEIAGLMTNRPFQEVGDTLEALNDALDVLEADRSFNPYLTMSFLCLPVIPELKLTDSGLFDVKHFQHISVQAN